MTERHDATTPRGRSPLETNNNSDLPPFLEWCDRQRLLPVPLAPKDIALFVKQSEALGIETIAATLAAISNLYLSRGLADPTAGGPVSESIDAIAKLTPPRSWPKRA